MMTTLPKQIRPKGNIALRYMDKPSKDCYGRPRDQYHVCSFDTVQEYRDFIKKTDRLMNTKSSWSNLGKKCISSFSNHSSTPYTDHPDHISLRDLFKRVDTLSLDNYQDLLADTSKKLQPPYQFYTDQFKGLLTTIQESLTTFHNADRNFNLETFSSPTIGR